VTVGLVRIEHPLYTAVGMKKGTLLAAPVRMSNPDQLSET
jgi:hypothetical protein